MSLDKAITHGQEHRRPYYRSGRFDKTCRPHGGCEWCLGNRMYGRNRQVEEANDRLVDFSRPCLDTEV